MSKYSKSGNYTKLEKAVRKAVKDDKIKPTSAVVYIALNEAEFEYSKSDGGGWFYQSDSQLIEATGFSKNTVLKAKRELELAGLIETRFGEASPATRKAKSKMPVTWYRLILEGAMNEQTNDK